MEIGEYKRIREVAKNMGDSILNFEKFNHDNIVFAGKALGIWDGTSLVFEDESDNDVLMDFIIYEKNKQGLRLIDEYYDSETELSDLENEILQGMVESQCSLFEIMNIDKDAGKLLIVDLVSNPQKQYTLMDIFFSRTAKVGVLAFIRLVPIRGIHMTSGASIPFPPEEKARLMGEYSFERFKKRRQLDSSQLFVFAFKKGKLYGSDLLRREIS